MLKTGVWIKERERERERERGRQRDEEERQPEWGKGVEGGRVRGDGEENTGLTGGEKERRKRVPIIYDYRFDFP